jgi:hypothetical protein
MRGTKSIDLVNTNDGTNCPPFVQTFDQKKSESFAEGKDNSCSSVFLIEMKTISRLRIGETECLALEKSLKSLRIRSL